VRVFASVGGSRLVARGQRVRAHSSSYVTEGSFASTGNHHQCMGKTVIFIAESLGV
jgi:hypothetical protein